MNSSLARLLVPARLLLVLARLLVPARFSTKSRSGIRISRKFLRSSRNTMAFMGLSGDFRSDTAAESSLIWIFRYYYPDFIPLCAVKQQKFSYFKRFFPVILFLHQKTAISAHWKNFPVSISNPCIEMQGFLIPQADGMPVISQKRGLSHWRSMIVRAMPPLILLLDTSSLQFTVCRRRLRLCCTA